MERDESAAKSDPRARRQKRLAEALRANLRRRKVASRAVEAERPGRAAEERDSQAGSEKDGR